MSPIEHYFENLLVRGSDNKGEPNKNALSKEVQEAIEICAYYIKNIPLYRNAIPNDSNSEKVVMLKELQLEIEGMDSREHECDFATSWCVNKDTVIEIIQDKINALKENTDGNK